SLPDQLLDLFLIDHAIHRGEQLLLALRIIAVEDGLHQHLAQWAALKQLAKHIVDAIAAAQRLPRPLQLLQKARIDLTLSRVSRDKVPKMTDLSLADAVNATEPLLKAVRVPRQIVVHHEVGATLQVD